jgi:hypothetical protein
MTSARDSLPDARRSRLRGTLAVLEHEISLLEGAISLLAAEGANDNREIPADDLRASVADLVQQLALGAEPAYRACPVCGRIGMRAATLCGHCWTKLTPSLARDGVSG